MMMQTISSLIFGFVVILSETDSFVKAQLGAQQFPVRRPVPYRALNGGDLNPNDLGGNGDNSGPPPSESDFQLGYGGLEQRYFVAGQTLTFAIKFRNFEADRIPQLGRVVEADPIDEGQVTYVEVPPNEGRVGVTVELERANYLTTVLRPTLYTTRPVVLNSRGLTFSISLRLKNGGSQSDTFQGVGVELPIDDPRYEANAPITLRWPIPWTSLTDYASNGVLSFEVTIAVRNRKTPYRFTIH